MKKLYIYNFEYNLGCIKKKGKQYETKTEQQQELDILITTEGRNTNVVKVHRQNEKWSRGVNNFFFVRGGGGIFFISGYIPNFYMRY